MSAASLRAIARALPAIAVMTAITTVQARAQEADTVRESQTCICTPGAPPARGMPALVSPGALPFPVTGNRARLGLVLGDDVQVDGRSGVRVDEVVTGGPAERAGLRGGDVITGMNGKALGDEPADAIVDRMGDVEPGDTVAISYRRDGRTLEASVVAARTPPGELMVRARPDLDRIRVAPGAPGRPGQPGGVWELRSGHDAPGMRLFFGGRAGGLELVDMNPELGAYFGTSNGVLVTAVRADSLGLRAGDVILSIDGRDVMDAEHAREIMASYRPDETIRFQIMRQKKRTTVSGHRGAPGE